eukprot:m51a1_g11108 hypothetical protein (283) ;mRNA; f:70228-71076
MASETSEMSVDRVVADDASSETEDECAGDDAPGTPSPAAAAAAAALRCEHCGLVLVDEPRARIHALAHAPSTTPSPPSSPSPSPSPAQRFRHGICCEWCARVFREGRKYASHCRWCPKKPRATSPATPPPPAQQPQQAQAEAESPAQAQGQEERERAALSCEWCRKGFARRKYLNAHRRVCGARPDDVVAMHQRGLFDCEYCGALIPGARAYSAHSRWCLKRPDSDKKRRDLFKRHVTDDVAAHAAHVASPRPSSPPLPLGGVAGAAGVAQASLGAREDKSS